MKKFYALIVVCLLCVASGYSQDTYTWIGPVNGLWTTDANWEDQNGDPGVPDGPLDNVSFSTGATILLNDQITLNRLVIATTQPVSITATGGEQVLELSSADDIDRALSIQAGGDLQLGADITAVLELRFLDNAKANISGRLFMTGVDAEHSAFLTVPAATGLANSVDINDGGSVVFSPTSFFFPNDEGNNYIHFNSGSELWLQGDGPSIQDVDYDDASTIRVTGVFSSTPLFSEFENRIGNLIYDCPTQTTTDPAIMGFPNGFTIAGNLSITNTNGRELQLIDFVAIPNVFTRTLSVEGNLNISGTSVVTVSNMDATGVSVEMYVQGNIDMSGTSFSLRSDNFNSHETTTLFVGGNINHTAGIFGALSGIVDESKHLFVIDMNGNALQTISSLPGNINNSADQLTLKISNPAGVSLLNPLTVGRVSFNSSSTGILTTGASAVLTISNAANNSFVLEAPTATGHINGPFARRTTGTSTLVMDTWDGSVNAPATIVPSTGNSSLVSTYQAGFVNAAHPTLTYQPPIEGIANYYWNIDKVGGAADAQIQLPVLGAVSGAAADDYLVVSRFNGTNWETARGSTGTTLPGNSTSGTLISGLLTNFSPFTIGFGSNAVLPIHLVSFTAKKSSASSATLNWTITEESTPEVFEVMKSRDGVNFSRLSTVTGMSGKTSYSFNDAELFSGSNYYRLKMIDRDGTASFSAIVGVMNGTKGVLISSIMPSIVTDRARLNVASSESGNLQLVITDISGRIVQRRMASVNSGNQEIWIDATKLSSGIFHVTGYMNGEKTATFRFFKR